MMLISQIRVQVQVLKCTMKIISFIESALRMRTEFLELWSGMSLNFYYLVLMLFLEFWSGSGLEADWKWTGKWTLWSSFINSQVGLGVLIVQKWPPSFKIVLP